MARITAPNSPVPNHIVIQVDGIGDVEVGPEWNDLTPEQQSQAVEEIVADYGSRQSAPAQPAGPQAQQIDIRPGLTREGQGPAGFGDVLLSGGSFGDALAAIPQRAEYQFNELAPRVAGLAQGAASVLDNGADLLEGAYNNTLGRVFGRSNSADPQLNISDLITSGAPQGAFERLAGNLGQGDPTARTVGQLGAAAFLTRGMGGPATQGAGAGALLSEADSGLGVARDAGIGAIGGVIGDRIVRGVTNLVLPPVTAAARALHERGVRMTPGQVLPGAMRRWEDRMTSRPHVGDRIIEGRQQSYRDFNRAAVDEVLAPAGIQLPRNVEPGQQAVRWAGDQLSDRYERLIPRLQMRPDQQFAQDLADVATQITNGDLTPAAQRQFLTILENQVRNRLNGPVLDGRAYRQIERSLGAQIRRFGNSPDPDHQAMVNAFESVQDAMQGALARSNPQHADELVNLNTSWRNLVRVEDAAGASPGGLFSPNRFRQSVRRGDNSTRRRGMARGEAPMQDLAEAAVEALPPDYPDSGTSGRQQDNVYDPRYWIGLLQSQVYGPRAQQALTEALMAPRPQAAQSIADLLRLLPAPQAGAAGTGAIAAPFVSPVP